MNVKVKGGGVDTLIEFLTSEKYRVFISIIGTLILCICSLIWFNVSDTKQTSKANNILLNTLDSTVIVYIEKTKAIQADVNWAKGEVISQGKDISELKGRYNQRGKYFKGNE